MEKNQRVRLARLSLGLSQQQLANRTGVSRQTIVMIENGNYNPSINLCITLCRVLGKTLNDLFWEE